MGSTYHIDPASISLDALKRNLAKRRMLPSRVALKVSLDERFQLLARLGIRNLADLLDTLKTKKRILAFSKRSGLGEDYLTLLRREANSFLPNPVQLAKLPGGHAQTVRKLDKLGVKNTKQLFDAISQEGSCDAYARKIDSSEAGLTELFYFSDLSRLYGIKPMFARLFIDMGVRSVDDFVKNSAAEIVKMYEDKTGKSADFTENDVQFAVDMARVLLKHAK